MPCAASPSSWGAEARSSWRVRARRWRVASCSSTRSSSPASRASSASMCVDPPFAGGLTGVGADEARGGVGALAAQRAERERPVERDGEGAAGVGVEDGDGAQRGEQRGGGGEDVGEGARSAAARGRDGGRCLAGPAAAAARGRDGGRRRAMPAASTWAPARPWPAPRRRPPRPREATWRGSRGGVPHCGVAWLRWIAAHPRSRAGRSAALRPRPPVRRAGRRPPARAPAPRARGRTGPARSRTGATAVRPAGRRRATGRAAAARRGRRAGRSARPPAPRATRPARGGGRSTAPPRRRGGGSRAGPLRRAPRTARGAARSGRPPTPRRASANRSAASSRSSSSSSRRARRSRSAASATSSAERCRSASARAEAQAACSSASSAQCAATGAAGGVQQLDGGRAQRELQKVAEPRGRRRLAQGRARGVQRMLRAGQLLPRGCQLPLQHGLLVAQLGDARLGAAGALVLVGGAGLRRADLLDRAPALGGVQGAQLALDVRDLLVHAGDVALRERNGIGGLLALAAQAGAPCAPRGGRRGRCRRRLPARARRPCGRTRGSDPRTARPPRRLPAARRARRAATPARRACRRRPPAVRRRARAARARAARSSGRR